MATPSGILAWRIPYRGTWRATVHGAAKNLTRLKRLSMHHRRFLIPVLSQFLEFSFLINFNVYTHMYLTNNAAFLPPLKLLLNQW